MPYGETESELLKELLTTLGGQPAYGDSINDLLRKSIIATGALVLAAQSGGGGGATTPATLPNTLNLLAGDGAGGASDSGVSAADLRKLEVVDVVNADYAMDGASGGKLIRMNSASAQSVPVLDDTTLPLPDGFQLVIRQAGVGQVTISPTGTTVNPPNGATLILKGQGSTVTLVRVGANEWDLIGDTQTA